MNVMIRRAREEDIPQLMDIYNEAILHTTATFDMQEKTLEDRQNWFFAHRGKYLLYVATEGKRILGYASLSAYSERPAYDGTVEFSVYISEEYHGQGLGTALTRKVLEEAKHSMEIHSVVSLITAENEVSVKLHEKLGFTFCGRMKEAGFKFGRHLDVDIYQMMI